MNRLLLKECLDELRSDDSIELTEGKDRLIDRLPSLDDAQKARMKRFFAKRPSLESEFDWNRPDSITWDAFQNIASGYEEPIDPDTVPEFSDKRDEGDGIVSYEVQDDRAGQYAVRSIIDTHWGKKANPWCLSARDKYELSPEEARDWYYSLTDEERERLNGFYPDPGTSLYQRYREHGYGLHYAWRFWEQYSSVPKRIAFKDGKLLAFMASDKGRWFGEKWWDRNDNSHPSVHDCA